MIETALVFAVVALLCGTAMAPLAWVLGTAAACLGIGLVVGVPTGLWYHVALRRALLARGELPARWWLRPVLHHDTLGTAERAAVMPWFYIGGVGFLFTALGCVVLGAAALRLVISAS